MTRSLHRSLHSLVLASLLALPLSLTAQDSNTIHFDAATKVFRIDAAGTTYAFGVNNVDELQPLFWGRSIAATDSLPAAHTLPEVASFDGPGTVTQGEYKGWGGQLYLEPALKVTFPDGNRDLVLHYVSHHIEGDTLTIVTKDIERDLFVELRYTVDPATGILGRSAIITNKATAPVMIEQAAAATWNLPRGTNYTLNYLTGRWAGEDQLQQQLIRPGETVLQSTRGSTGHQNNPWFAIERGPSTDEDTGDVWFGALAWSGSWRITVEQDQLQQVRVTGGFNPFDFSYKLAPSQSLETPVFYGGYSDHGLGGASRLLHRFELTKILPQSPNPRPVLYNSWEATTFHVDEAGQEALAEKAASIGIERFVMDDGWFGQRKDDHAGLGDWYVNPQKFPHGLKPLIDKVHSLGMDFGLWVEPEMVNPDSDLYRKHPDWVLNFTGRPRTQERNQLVLNLARPDVRDYVFHFLDDLLAHNDIAFLKWDYNRNWTEPGWPAVAPDEQKKVYVAYTRNLYSILHDLRAKYPKLEIESCSGGGGRVDLGIMHYTDEVWPSDNTDPFDRLSIQDGFTYAYTPGVMMAWVTDSPGWANNRTTSVTYRFLSSMQGSLGVGANLNKWTPEDFATAKDLIAAYKGIRETVQHGSLYRLVSPRNGSETSVTESVSLDKKQAALFTFLHSSTMNYPYPRVFLRGLNPNTSYRVTSISGKLATDTPTTATGSYWMSHGLDVELKGDFQAAAFRFDAQ
ncbi:alpha-galactosidase [Granulicella sp. 5B5]|uniref:alpha-galactosidase n=1 Tax=Granulicella sp. 5B5 TaxID=1617967 RepID=UPI0015F4BDC7|nr:alpha-galactosidase [Granulicella sp. 5B5]QMV18883.1 alpha-galactosidase [Granulicella sp. 5B5]